MQRCLDDLSGVTQPCYGLDETSVIARLTPGGVNADDDDVQLLAVFVVSNFLISPSTSFTISVLLQVL